MIETLFDYLKNEVAPRWRAVVFSSSTAIAISISISVGAWGDRTGLAHVKVTDAATALLTYAAIAFGFCLAGLTIALTLPNDGFAKRLAVEKLQKKPELKNAYSHLLFVFSWTACCHWLAVSAALSMLVALGGEHTLFFEEQPCWQFPILGAVAGLFAYDVCQFLVTLLTLSQLGEAYIKHLQDEAAKAKSTT